MERLKFGSNAPGGGVKILAVVLLLFCSVALSFAGTVTLPQTGQTKCYDSVGAQLPSCAGTGQDGAKRMGVAWPAQRFSDNGNGTITDALTGLIWLQNANCTETVGGIAKTNGYLTWANAITWSNNLANGNCGLTDGSVAGDWRLPGIIELESLVHEGYNEQDCGGVACGTNAAWLMTQGFNSVQSNFYWSSTTYAYTWYVQFGVGGVGYTHKMMGFYVWPVRGGVPPEPPPPPGE